MNRSPAIGLAIAMLWPACAMADPLPPAPLAYPLTGTLGLPQAVALALARDPDLQAADLTWRRSALQVDDADAERVSVGTSVNGGDLYGSNGILASSGSPPRASNAMTTNGRLDLSVPIFSGFKISGDIQGADARRDQYAAQLRQARADLIEATTRDYWEVARHSLLVDVQQAALVQAQRTWELASKRVAEGNATQADADRAHATAINQQSSLLVEEGARDDAVEALATLLQVDPGQLHIVDATPPLHPTTVTAETEMAIAMQQRPELRATREAVREAEGARMSAFSGRFPQLSLVADTQYGNNPYIPTQGNYSVLDSFQGQWDAGFNLSMNLFDNGVTWRQGEEADLLLAISRARYEAELWQVHQDVDQAVIGVNNAEARLAIAQQAMTLAKRALDWTQARYQLGYALLVDVDDARTTYVSAEGNAAEAAIDYLEARTALAHATGTL